MPKDDTLQKHTLNLFVGDMEKLQEYFPDVGASVVIRKLVRAYIEKIEDATSDHQIAVEVNI